MPPNKHILIILKLKSCFAKSQKFQKHFNFAKREIENSRIYKIYKAFVRVRCAFQGSFEQGQSDEELRISVGGGRGVGEGEGCGGGGREGISFFRQ